MVTMGTMGERLPVTAISRNSQSSQNFRIKKTVLCRTYVQSIGVGRLSVWLCWPHGKTIFGVQNVQVHSVRDDPDYEKHCTDMCPKSGIMNRIWRDGIQKILPITFGENPTVKNDDDAGVVLTADQAAYALAKFQHGFGQAVPHE